MVHISMAAMIYCKLQYYNFKLYIYFCGEYHVDENHNILF